MNTAIKLPVIAGVEITTDAEGRFNLNALHRASEAKSHKRPSKWLETPQAKELVLELNRQSPQEGFAHAVINSVRGGTSPGTFAHELLAISYAGWISPSFQLKVNRVFLDYKTGKLADTKPMSTLEALESALHAEKERLRLEAEKEQLECQVLEFKPKVEALDRIATAHGSMCLTDAAKTLQMKPGELTLWLLENKWVYRREDNRKIVGFQVRIDQGFIEHKVYQYESQDEYGEPMLKTSTQAKITPKGLAKIAEKIAQ